MCILVSIAILLTLSIRSAHERVSNIPAQTRKNRRTYGNDSSHTHTQTEDDSRLDEWTAKNPLRSDSVVIKSWKNIAILIMWMGKS